MDTDQSGYTESEFAEQTEASISSLDEGSGLEAAYLLDEKSGENAILERRTARGRVRWFSRSLGYGFIHEEGFAEEIFVHHDDVQVPGVRYLRCGQRVAFEWCRTKNGLMAINVIPIMESSVVLARKHARHGD